MSRQLSYQRSSLLKRSQRTSELAEITPKATLLLLLVLQVTQVELPGQAGLQLTLQRHLQSNSVTSSPGERALLAAEMPA